MGPWLGVSVLAFSLVDVEVEDASSERDEGWMVNLPAEVFLVVLLACDALSEAADEAAFVLDDEPEADGPAVEALDAEEELLALLPVFAFEALLLSLAVLAEERPSTSSANCCKISRCRLVSDRGMVTSNCTTRSPF